MTISTVEVVGAVIIRGDRILACRRAPHKSAAGMWEFPGGKVEPTERPEHALSRELAEELGVTAHPIRLLHRETTRVADTMIDLACFETVISAEPIASSDHDKIRWVPMQELAQLEWAQPDIPTVELLIAENLRLQRSSQH